MPEKNSTAQSKELQGKNSCHHERHMSGVTLKTYNLFWRMGKKSKDGSLSLPNHRIAELVGARSTGKRADHITRAKMVLVRAGLLEFLGVSRKSGTGNWRGGRYRAVPHDEWVEMKTKETGHSPCHPDPLQVKVSSVKPGGRGFQNMRRKLASENAEVRTDLVAKQSHRAGGEVRTACVAGSTHRATTGKYAQSVDFDSTGDLRSRSKDQLTQGAAPPATPPALPADLPERQGGASPSQTHPLQKPSFGQQVRVGCWGAMRIDQATVATDFRRAWEFVCTGNPYAKLLDLIREAERLCRQEKIAVPKEFLLAKARIAKSTPRVRLLDCLEASA